MIPGSRNALVAGFAAKDPNFASLILGSHFNGTNGSTTFVDIKGHSLTASGTAAISTAQSKFGGASLGLDGSSTAFVTTNANFGPSADFSVATWVWFANTTGTQMILEVPTTSGFGVYTSNGNFVVEIYGVSNPINVAWSPSTSAWHYIVVQRIGTNLSAIADGTTLSTVTNSTAFTSGGITIGGRSGSSSTVNGYIDDLRVYTGVGIGGTVPTSAFADQ